MNKKNKGVPMYFHDKVTGDVMFLYEDGSVKVKKSIAPRVPNIRSDKRFWVYFRPETLAHEK